MLEAFGSMAAIAIDWVTQNPWLAAGAVVGLVGLRWLLNRRSGLERESERVIRGITRAEKGKYDDLRPLG